MDGSLRDGNTNQTRCTGRGHLRADGARIVGVVPTPITLSALNRPSWRMPTSTTGVPRYDNLRCGRRIADDDTAARLSSEMN